MFSFVNPAERKTVPVSLQTTNFRLNERHPWFCLELIEDIRAKCTAEVRANSLELLRWTPDIVYSRIRYKSIASPSEKGSNSNLGRQQID